MTASPVPVLSDDLSNVFFALSDTRGVFALFFVPIRFIPAGAQCACLHCIFCPYVASRCLVSKQCAAQGGRHVGIATCRWHQELRGEENAVRGQAGTTRLRPSLARLPYAYPSVRS